MNKRVVLAEKVDHIDIEVRPTWTLEECHKLAQRMANDHNIQVRFKSEDQEICVDPEFTLAQNINLLYPQMTLPGFSP